MIRRTPRSTLTDQLVPYPTPFRPHSGDSFGRAGLQGPDREGRQARSGNIAGADRGGTGTGRVNRGRYRRARPAVRSPVRLRTAQRGRHSGRRGYSFGPASVDTEKPARGYAPALTAARRTPLPDRNAVG